MAEAAIGIDALDGSAMHAVGFAQLESGNYEEAVEAMGDRIRFHPDSRWSWVKHALAPAHDGQCEQAEKQALLARLNFPTVEAE